MKKGRYINEKYEIRWPVKSKYKININGQNALIRRQKLSDWAFKEI